MASPPLTNLKLWISADVNAWKDTAGTVPAVADGDAVARWDDRSGNSYSLTQVAPTQRPALKLGVAGSQLKQAVRFTTASHHYLVTTGSVSHNIGTGDFWLAAVWMPTNNSIAFNSICSIGTFAPAFYWPSKSGAYPIGNTFYLGGGNLFSPTNNANIYNLTEEGRISGVVKQWNSHGGTAPTLDANSYTVAASIANAVVYAGWDNSGTDYYDGDIAEMLLYGAALSAPDQATLENYLLNKYWGVAIPGGPAGSFLHTGTGPAPQR